MVRILLINTSEFYLSVPVYNLENGEKDSINLMPNGARAMLPDGYDIDMVWLNGQKGVRRHELKPEGSVEPAVPIVSKGTVVQVRK